MKERTVDSIRWNESLRVLQSQSGGIRGNQLALGESQFWPKMFQEILRRLTLRKNMTSMDELTIGFKFDETQISTDAAGWSLFFHQSTSVEWSKCEKKIKHYAGHRGAYLFLQYWVIGGPGCHCGDAELSNLIVAKDCKFRLFPLFPGQCFKKESRIADDESF